MIPFFDNSNLIWVGSVKLLLLFKSSKFLLFLVFTFIFIIFLYNVFEFINSIFLFLNEKRTGSLYISNIILLFSNFKIELFKPFISSSIFKHCGIVIFFVSYLTESPFEQAINETISLWYL